MCAMVVKKHALTTGESSLIGGVEMLLQETYRVIEAEAKKSGVKIEERA